MKVEGESTRVKGQEVGTEDCCFKEWSKKVSLIKSYLSTEISQAGMKGKD